VQNDKNKKMQKKYCISTENVVRYI
jgi:hypothetical protein